METIFKSGDRITVKNGYGYTWHDNGVQKFRRVNENGLNATVTSMNKLTIFAKTDAGATIELKFNSSYIVSDPNN